jgi:drug/metabolite transporter (DMT)-like permease
MAPCPGTGAGVPNASAGWPQCMGLTASAILSNRSADLLPGLTAAVSFSFADILLKVVFLDGVDALSLATLRGVVVVAFFMIWLRVGSPARQHTRRERMIALGIGLLFSVTMFGLLQAIALLPVSIAILAYFVYPLLTGLAGAATGVDRVGWRALAAAGAAFIGLAMMLGFHLEALAPIGLACAFIAAIARVVTLLLTRAYLNRADARLTTWYSMVPSTVVYLLAVAVVRSWTIPATTIGWGAFLGVTVTTTLSTLLIYISTARIGPFRTALLMNLEPLLTTLFSILLLGETLTMAQAAGAALMIASLVAFQVMRTR